MNFSSFINSKKNSCRGWGTEKSWSLTTNSNSAPSVAWWRQFDIRITEISDYVSIKEPITWFSYKDFESDATALSFTEEDFIRHAHCLAWSTLPFILRLSFKPSKPLQRTALPFKVIWNHKAWRTKLETSQILF